MSAYTNLLDSDTLVIGSMEFDLNGPSQVNPGHRTKSNICVGKFPGQLRFKLNTVSDLGIKEPFDFDVEFIGQLVGNVMDDPAVVKWSVNQSIDRDFSTSGVDVHIDQVNGSLSTALHARNPRGQGQDCGGAGRSIGVDLGTIGNVNSLDISASVLGSGVGISADNITLTADGRDQFAIDARINVIVNECGIAATAPGGEVHFWAQVNNVPVGDTIGYSWSVNGAAIVGPTTEWLLKVQLGADSTPVIVTVVVTVEGVSQSLTLNYQPDTAQSVRIKTLRCRVMRFLRVNLFVDPLWDPLRDYVVKPMTRTELQRLDQFAGSLQTDIASLWKLQGERN